MPKRRRLENYFPVQRGVHKKNSVAGFISHPENINKEGYISNDELSTRHRVILSLEMQGLTKQDIASRVGMDPGSITQITNSDKYIAYREEYLSKIDNEFFAMKPLAFAALKNGLTSEDEDTALKASDQWFKAASFGGYSKRDEPPRDVTAEDVVRQLLNVTADNVQINVKIGQDD